jgi:hypothetical protein
MVLQDGSSTQMGEVMDALNLVFTIYFTIELAVCVYANWFTVFFYNWWNHLDIFIVTMSLIDFGPLDVPNWFVQLMRALRVIRLFGRIHALKKMIAAVTASLFPMMNAFIILLIVISICASSLLSTTLRQLSFSGTTLSSPPHHPVRFSTNNDRPHLDKPQRPGAVTRPDVPAHPAPAIRSPHLYASLLLPQRHTPMQTRSRGCLCSR